MNPVKHDGSSTGGPETPFEKPMDKPPKEYGTTDRTPRHGYHEEPLPMPENNPQDRSKKFRA